MPSIHPSEFDFSGVKCNNYADALKEGYLNKILFSQSYTNRFINLWSGLYANSNDAGWHNPGFSVYIPPSYDVNLDPIPNTALSASAWERIWKMVALMRLDKVFREYLGDVEDAKDDKSPVPTEADVLDLHDRMYKKDAKVEGMFLKWDTDKLDIEAIDLTERTTILANFKAFLDLYTYNTTTGSYKIRFDTDREYTPLGVQTRAIVNVNALTRQLVDGEYVDVANILNPMILNDYVPSVFGFLINVVLPYKYGTGTLIYGPEGTLLDEYRLIANGSSFEFTWSDIESAVEYTLLDQTYTQKLPGKGGHTQQVIGNRMLAFYLLGVDIDWSKHSTLTSKRGQYLPTTSSTLGIDLASQDPDVALWMINNILSLETKIDRGRNWMLIQFAINAVSLFLAGPVALITDKVFNIFTMAFIGTITSGAYDIIVSSNSITEQLDDVDDTLNSLSCDDDNRSMEKWYPERQIESFMRSGEAKALNVV